MHVASVLNTVSLAACQISFRKLKKQEERLKLTMMQDIALRVEYLRQDSDSHRRQAKQYFDARDPHESKSHPGFTHRGFLTRGPMKSTKKTVQSVPDVASKF